MGPKIIHNTIHNIATGTHLPLPAPTHADANTRTAVPPTVIHLNTRPPHAAAHTHHPHHVPLPATPPPLRRSTRAQAATRSRPRPQPAAGAVILHTVGRDIPQRDRHELQTLLDTFHAIRHLQDQCRLILENSLEFLVSEHVDGQGGHSTQGHSGRHMSHGILLQGQPIRG